MFFEAVVVSLCIGKFLLRKVFIVFLSIGKITKVLQNSINSAAYKHPKYK